MKYKLSHTLILFIACSMCGCITEYDSPVSDEVESLLVVDGIITGGETKITLSRSVSLSSDLSNMQWINRADVWVESEDGVRYEASGEATNGEYIVPVGELNRDTRYRLRISLDGQEYESDFTAPQQTPPIADIDFHQKGYGEPLQVRLDVRGEAGQSRYYFWDYDEIWEIRAHQYAFNYLGVEGVYDDYYSYGYVTYRLNADYSRYIQAYDPRSISPYYYCWKYGGTQSILLGSSDKLKENSLTDHVLYEIGISDDRLSLLYYTKVKQYSLSQDAYYYFNNLKKNTEESGGIFSPVPSEMRGNISCTTSPDIPVIGYIEVSECQEKEVYLNSGDTPYLKPVHTCDIRIGVGQIEANEAYDFYLYWQDELNNTYWTHSSCIDCRTQGGSKTRPHFWPNEHF